ncbi:MAG TPA: FecR domain-containing protein [Puia sp.]|nr:FecR domain-containing protein [Puia sp.]
MDVNEHVRLLFDKYLRKECSAEEFEEMMTWLLAMDEGEKNKLSAPLKELWDKAMAHQLPSTAERVDWDNVYNKVVNVGEQDSSIPIDINQPRRMEWKRVAIAIVLFGVLISASLWFLNRKTPKEIVKIEKPVTHQPEEILPKGNQALLTLSNGSVVVLDSTKNGIITNQGNVRVIKLDSGQLAYRPVAANGTESSEITYNTISTPRAAQYEVVLSDGTKVWLNAASSLKYPTAFSGQERKVELTGEGYFEVAKNKDKPFHVRVGSVGVEVTGTHFNIMAYEDEASIQTTLLEGSVKVSANGQSDVLKPGKQASLNRGDSKLTTGDANVQQAIAWKNGYFYFDRSDVKTIMRQVSRWYDLDIVYESNVPDMKFSGKIERNLPLSGISHLLESGQIHFRIEGKNCIMMK